MRYVRLLLAIGVAVLVMPGSWWQLDAVLKEAATYENYYRSMPPTACPRCGEPLRAGPPQEPAIRFCIYDGWEYPRDYDPESQSGM